MKGSRPYALPDLLARAALDTVEGAFAYGAGSDMTIPDLGHRERWRLTLSDAEGREHTVFMKRYGREPLSWRIKRVLTYGWGRGPARIELDNIHAAHAEKVGAIDQAVCGEEHDALGAARGYIVMSTVAGEALEQCFERFLADNADRPERVEQFTDRLIELVGRFHQAGYVHRDLYTSHIFLAEREGRIELRLIDLARMFRPRWRPMRWRVKDLAQLKFSMPQPWLDAHWDRFLTACLGDREARRVGRYRRAIDRKIARIARHDAKKRARRQAREAREAEGGAP